MAVVTGCSNDGSVAQEDARRERGVVKKSQQSTTYFTLKQIFKFNSHIGLIKVKKELTGFFKGWEWCSMGFPEGEARGKSQEAALPARGKPRPS